MDSILTDLTSVRWWFNLVVALAISVLATYARDVLELARRRLRQPGWPKWDIKAFILAPVLALTLYLFLPLSSLNFFIFVAVELFSGKFKPGIYFDLVGIALLLVFLPIAVVGAIETFENLDFRSWAIRIGTATSAFIFVSWAFALTRNAPKLAEYAELTEFGRGLVDEGLSMYILLLPGAAVVGVIVFGAAVVASRWIATFWSGRKR